MLTFRKKPAEIRKVIGYDGVEHILISVDCQTEWSWLDDQKVSRRMATPNRFSRSSTRASLSMPGEINRCFDNFNSN